jgi:hypothetical protein
MGLKRLIADNIKETRELREVISKDGVDKIHRCEEYDKDMKVLRGILRAKAAPSFDGKGEPILIVSYRTEIPTQRITCDDSGEIGVSDLFRILNKYGLVSMEDRQELAKQVDLLRSQYKGKK